MRYTEFRDRISQELQRRQEGMSWAQLQRQLKLPNDAHARIGFGGWNATLACHGHGLPDEPWRGGSRCLGLSQG